MEGVIRIDRAVAWATAPGRSTRDVLDLAMQVEANSLDLYLKLVRREDLAPLRPLLERLVGEEKAHLAGLGKRLEEVPA
jgi:rubrerythrin